MPITVFAVLLAVCAVASLAAAIWLLLHLQAVAAAFRGTADVVPGRRAPKTSKGAVWTALIIFNAGWIACILIWVFVMSGAGNEVGTPV